MRWASPMSPSTRRRRSIASASGNQVHLWDPGHRQGDQDVLVISARPTSRSRPSRISPDGKLLAVGGRRRHSARVRIGQRQGRFHQPAAQCPHREGRVQPQRQARGRWATGTCRSRCTCRRPKNNQLAMSIQGVDLGEVRGRRVFARQRQRVHLRDGRQGAAHRRPQAGRRQRPNTATQLREFTGHSGRVTGAGALPPTANSSSPAADDKTVRVWESPSRQATSVVPGAHDEDHRGRGAGRRQAVASASDDGRFASGI